MRTENSTARCAAVALAVLALGVPALGTSVGAQPPLPQFEGVEIRAVVSRDPITSQNIYGYTVMNPARNSIGIMHVMVEITGTPPGAECHVFGPPDWFLHDATEDGFTMWHVKVRTAYIAPGALGEGFGLRTAALPAIRMASVKADIVGYLEDHDIDLDIPEVLDLHERYTLSLKTLGPLGVPVGTFEHWNTFESDLAQTAELGWISDAALLASLKGSLQAARQAVLARNGPQAIAHLQAMITAIEGSSESQRSSEGYALVNYNAESLRDHLPIPAEPRPVPVPQTR